MALMLGMIIRYPAVLVYISQGEIRSSWYQLEESQSDTGSVAVPNEGKQAGRALLDLGGIVSNFSGEVSAIHNPVKSPENRRPITHKLPEKRTKREPNEKRK